MGLKKIRKWRREGIRTPDTVTRILAFQASPFNHSGTSPMQEWFGLRPGNETEFPCLVWLVVWSDMGKPQGETYSTTTQFNKHAWYV